MVLVGDCLSRNPRHRQHRVGDEPLPLVEFDPSCATEPPTTNTTTTTTTAANQHETREQLVAILHTVWPANLPQVTDPFYWLAVWNIGAGQRNGCRSFQTQLADRKGRGRLRSRMGKSSFSLRSSQFPDAGVRLGKLWKPRAAPNRNFQFHVTDRPTDRLSN